jgi:predicted RNA-binding Zn-ribbon protein involved in translation (DUF1610 family)
MARISCDRCHRMDDVADGVRKFKCSHCGSRMWTWRCRGCRTTSGRWLGQQTQDPCPRCGHKHVGLGWKFSSTTDLAAEQRQLGLVSDELNAVAVSGCTVLGGFGHGFQAGTLVGLLLDSAALTITPPPDPSSRRVYTELAALEVGDATTGGGTTFIGGGFGLEGAVEGMAIANVLSKLANRQEKASLLALRTASEELILSVSGANAQELRILMSPAQQRVAAAPAQSPATGVADLSEQLSRLAEMHASGALTDDEFAEAKRRILDA